MHKSASGLLRAAATGALLLGFAQNAEAVVVRSAVLNFESGAQFTGTISFADDFSAVAGVSGVLTGYQDGVYGYTGTGSTAISWLWLGGLDFNPSPTQVATFLMNGTGYADYTNWISFAYDLAAAPAIVLAPGGPGFGYSINVDYLDPLVSGSLASVVPLPPALLLLLTGLLGIATLGRRRSRA